MISTATIEFLLVHRDFALGLRHDEFPAGFAGIEVDVARINAITGYAAALQLRRGALRSQGLDFAAAIDELQGVHRLGHVAKDGPGGGQNHASFQHLEFLVFLLALHGGVGPRDSVTLIGL